MRVVFVNPPILLPEVFAHYPTFSALGLLGNAAWLRQGSDHDVTVVDAFSLLPRLTIRPDRAEGYRQVGAPVTAVADAAAAAAGQGRAIVIVAVTMFSDLNRPGETLVPRTVAALAERLPEASIGLADLHVCGMNYFPYDPTKALDRMPGAAWALVGEGEPTLPELCRRLEAGAPLEGMPRLAHRGPDGAVLFDDTAPSPLADLDALPLPAFDLIDVERYFAGLADAIRADLVHEYHVVERQLPLMTSRGCPFRCSFCTNQVLALPYRAHSVDWVRRAVRELRDRYGVDRIMLLDDNVNADGERFSALVSALAEEGVPWDAINGYRADRLDRETIRGIAAAGNTKITVSAESGDPEVLRRSIRKGLKLSSVVKVAKLCAEEGIPLQVHYILGVPGETRAQVNKTLELATELFERHGAWPLLQHAIPFPGTRLYRECEERGWFVAPPESFSGAALEVVSIIRTPELGPDEVIAMKQAAAHLHGAMQTLAYVEVEPSCDQTCLSCHCEPHREGRAAPSRQALREDLERARFVGGRELFLGGGEPTLRRDLPEIVAEARELGFDKIALATNAHGFVRPELSRALVEAGVSHLVVDLHGPNASIHDHAAGLQGSFKWTLGGLKQALADGCASFEVTAAVTRGALESLPATCRLALRLGARHVHLRVPPPDSLAAERSEIPLWREALPWLQRATAAAPAGRVSVQGAALCLPGLPGALAPLPPWALSRSRRHKAKHPACLDCVAYLSCGGFYRPEHEVMYGMMKAAGVEPG